LLHEDAVSFDCSIRAVTQVLEQLPEALAIAVLAASKTSLKHQFAILPVNLHALAIEAAFPDIRSHQSLALNFSSPALKDSTVAYAVLHAATTATSALKRLDLMNIPVRNSDRLLQLIAAACTSALDVSLEYGHYSEVLLPELQHIEQLAEALSHNTALTRLKLTFRGDPCSGFNLDRLTGGLTDLQSLSLDVARHHRSRHHLSIPWGIIDPAHLTQLHLGSGYNLSNLPQSLIHLTKLQELHLYCKQLQQLPPVATLTALQSLELCKCHQIQQLPPLAMLTALHKLVLKDFEHFEQLRPLVTLTALLTLHLCNFHRLQQLPSLATLTALKRLSLVRCGELQQLPSLVTLTSMQSLFLWDCKEVQQLPPLSTSLQALRLHCCEKLQHLPPMATLTALQTLELLACGQLRWLPPLTTLTALQTLALHGCSMLQRGCLRLPLPQDCQNLAYVWGICDKDVLKLQADPLEEPTV
jgi:Leucine-rich repeat (LRR) protein